MIVPIWLVLAGIQLRVFRESLSWVDLMLSLAPLLLSLLFGAAVLQQLADDTGLWDEIAAALGAYLVLASIWAVGFALRYRYQSGQSGSS